MAKPGMCPYVLRRVLVSKKYSSTKTCVDYQDLNPKIKIYSYPLPCIDRVCPALFQALYLAALELLMDTIRLMSS